MQKAERRIGMGTMGLGEMLIRLGLRYGSAESAGVHRQAVQASSRPRRTWPRVELAKEKGPFPMFDAEKFLQSGFMQGMPEEVRKRCIKKYGIRNVSLLTQAPTGTTGTMVGTSTGIEPYYQWTYWRSGRLGMKEVRERHRGRVVRGPSRGGAQAREPARLLRHRPGARRRRSTSGCRPQCSAGSTPASPRRPTARRTGPSEQMEELYRWPGSWAARASPFTGTGPGTSRCSR